jgi:cyclopropane fatty-acyl-phospholipid synthase-like methyltransferase/rRNA maturation protein Nop10
MLTARLLFFAGKFMQNYTTRQTCRVCGGNELTHLFSLGEQAVSDFVDRKDVKTGNVVPIDIEQCSHCTLVQSKHTAPADILYKGTYWYRSGVTQTMRDALRDVTKSIEGMVKLMPGDVVLDIGSNDGTLLRSYENKKLVTVGVEPANNLVEEGRVGINLLLNDLWSIGILQNAIGDKKAKVITAIGMFYDMEDPNQFVRDIALALDEDGLFVAQLMCLKQTLEKRDVGNFAHEHLEFYTLESLQYLFNEHGLEIVEIEENSINGGSYRVYARHNKCVTDMLADERTFGNIDKSLTKVAEVVRLDTIVCNKLTASFYQEISRNRMACIKFIQDAAIEGKRVWVYGASTKGNVILQLYGLHNVIKCPRCGGYGSRNDMDLTSDIPMTCKACNGSKRITLIEGAADRDPSKWGKYTIGTSIPIMSEEHVRAAKPDYFLVLPYSFLPEFIIREKEWLSRGGKFIVPLPKFTVIGG